MLLTRGKLQIKVSKNGKIYKENFFKNENKYSNINIRQKDLKEKTIRYKAGADTNTKVLIVLWMEA